MSIELDVSLQLSQLKPTLLHSMTLASNEQMLEQHVRATSTRDAPTPLGVRRDGFHWHQYDWSVRGRDDVDAYLKFATRAGQALLESRSELLREEPGATIQAALGTLSSVYWADYWSFLLHRFAGTGRLPYRCDVNWHVGDSIKSQPFCMTSRLTVDLARASCDLWALHQERQPRSVWKPEPAGYVPIAPVVPPIVRPTEFDRPKCKVAQPGSASMGTTVPTAQPTPSRGQANPTTGAVPTSREHAKRQPLAWFPEARRLLRQDPDQTDASIAAAVGVSPSTLCRSDEYKAFAEQVRRRKTPLLRGYYQADRDGERSTVDAIAPPDCVAE